MPIKDYSFAEIRKWVGGEHESKYLNLEEVEHVAHCLRLIVDWYFDRLPHYDLDPFILAVLRNDFSDACGQADNTNARVLPVYAKFLYNNLPLDYKTKAGKQFGRR